LYDHQIIATLTGKSKNLSVRMGS